MSIDEREYKKLKQRAEDARTARDRAAGQLDATMQRLSEEYGCNTVKEAETRAKTLEAEAAKAEAAYDAAVEAFEEEWDERLG